MRGPRVSRREGQTPILEPEMVRALLGSFEGGDVVTLRDRAIVSTMLFSFARVGAVTKLDGRHYELQGSKASLLLNEKRGKKTRVPCHHELREVLDAFLALSHAGPRTPLFRSADWSVLVGCTSVAELDAAAAGLLETERGFESSAQYDAQGRLVQSQNPHGARHVHEYTEEGLPKQVSRIGPDGGSAEVIHAIEGYDIFGRATAVTRGKARTAYAYDLKTQRLASMTSKAGSKTLQALSYVYDAAGNIVRIRDGAHKTVTTGGESVEPVTRYRYDTLCRLVEASGREHHGQLPGGGGPGRGPTDTALQRVAAPNDVTAVRNYTQRYRYDVHGNLLELRHQLAARHSAGAWTRRNQYSEHGNRLRASAVGKTPTPELYPHDEFGRMQMPHLDEMEWDEFDQLRRVRRGTTEVFFQYVDGTRVRKWVVKGGRTEERVYVGGVEEFRKFLGSDPLDEGKVEEATFTEHAPGVTVHPLLFADVRINTPRGIDLGNAA